MRGAAESEAVPVRCEVNGEEWSGSAGPTEILLDFIRDRLGLRGAKRGCEWMVCGTCTVLVDDRPVSACGMLAADIDGRSVRTVEGLGADGQLHPLQRAFVEAVGSQCGYCTSGQLMSALALLARNPRPSRNEIVRWMETNLCRCGSYVGIVDAIEGQWEEAKVGTGEGAPDAGHRDTEVTMERETIRGG